MTFILCVFELCGDFCLLLELLLFVIKTGEKAGSENVFTSLSSVAFQQEVRNLAGSLPQLLHHKVLYITLHHCYIMVTSLTSLLHHGYIMVTSWLHHGYIMVTSLLLRHWLILQDQVTASLKKYLLMKNSLSYEPLLE